MAKLENDWRVWVSIACLAVVVIVGMKVLIKEGDKETRPMPCLEEQVYVWDDFPNNAECVSSTDHSAHNGMHDDDG